MCGIIGFVDKKNRLSKEEKEGVAERMLKEIEYRGKDSTGVFVNGTVAVGHNRLAIVDTSENATQPFFNFNRDIAMSYNGEIFNHLGLRHLIANNNYKTTSDTETLMHLYEEKKDDSFGLARGMFAVSIYDKKTEEIT